MNNIKTKLAFLDSLFYVHSPTIYISLDIGIHENADSNFQSIY